MIRELEATLASLNKEPGIAPDQIVEVRAQLLALQRFKLEQDHEYMKGVVALEKALGTWLVPADSR